MATANATSIGVLGAGSWGTALACVLAGKGLPVTLWGHKPDHIGTIARARYNAQYLPDVRFPESLTPTADLAAALRRQVLVFAVPTQETRALARSIHTALAADQIIVCASKGIEASTGKLLSAVFREELPAVAQSHLTFLAGPSFADEIARGDPTGIVIAGTDATVTAQIQDIFRTRSVLPYTQSDVTGVELGGAIKNVIAIAVGLVEGMGLGFNSRVLVVNRGLYEIIKIGVALGARIETFIGLSGNGDLTLTCMGPQSRNRRVGEALGRGQKLDDILDKLGMVAEGVTTAKALYGIIQRHHINAPLCTAVYQLLFEGKSPQQVRDELAALPIGEEHAGLQALLRTNENGHKG